MLFRQLNVTAVGLVCFISVNGVRAAPLARVNGAMIEHAEVQVPDETVLRHLGPGDRIKLTSPSSPDEVATVRLELEMIQLAKRIRELVRNQTMSAMIGEPTQTEIATLIKEQGKQLPASALDEDKEGPRILIKAYSEVLENKKDPNRIYDEQLANVMTLEEWRLRLDHDVTLEKLRVLRSLMEDARYSDTRAQDAAAREAIKNKKMNEEIINELAQTDREVATYLDLSMRDPTNEWIRSLGPRFLDEKRNDWWKRKYESAVIEVLDSRFTGIKERITQ